MSSAISTDRVIVGVTSHEHAAYGRNAMSTRLRFLAKCAGEVFSKRIKITWETLK